MIVPLLPHRPAQAEGEDDGQQLDGRHHDHHPDDHVQVITNHGGELAVAASGEVRVGGGGADDAGGEGRLEEERIPSQDAAGLRNLE